jgi:NAD(P)-dependent dehydrogenase (short-subunit alcohol dehydrogenase family)
MSSLRDKIVVVTGSTRGFGYAIAESMLEGGASVAITGRTREAVDRALNNLQAKGRLSGFILDVREEEQVYRLVQDVIKEFGRIDIWVNNAGYSNAAGLMLDMNPQDALDMFLSNDLGMLQCTQAILHYMLPRRQGLLVNIYGNGSFLRRFPHRTLRRNEGVGGILHSQPCKGSQRQRRADPWLQSGYVDHGYAHQPGSGG